MSCPDPIAHFQNLYAEAQRSEPFDPSRAALSTVDAEGHPRVRFVLVKHIDLGRFVVYTNLRSPKARELARTARAALAFHWASTGVQVRVTGAVEPVGEALADSYFASRSRGSQLGAWASEQSAPLSSREQLLEQVRAQAARFGEGPVVRPPFWSGLEILPSSIEFWHNRDDRLHDRFLHERVGGGWKQRRLSP